MLIWTIFVLPFHGGGPCADPHLGLDPLPSAPMGWEEWGSGIELMVVSMHSGCPQGCLPSSSLAARLSLFLSMRFTWLLWQEEEVSSLKASLLTNWSIDLLLDNLHGHHPPSTCMCPQRGIQSQGSYIHCPSLCSRSSIPGGKDLYSKQIAEKIMEEQLLMALVSPKTTV